MTGLLDGGLPKRSPRRTRRRGAAPGTRAAHTLQIALVAGAGLITLTPNAQGQLLVAPVGPDSEHLFRRRAHGNAFLMQHNPWS